MNHRQYSATVVTQRSALLRLASGVALIGVTLTGCTYPELPDYYGRPQLAPLDSSVNGTDVLAAMVRNAGHEVRFRRTLKTQEMKSVDAIVWFPDDWDVPQEDTINWFDEWLTSQSGRTVVYVGRDFDAAPIYWRQMLKVVGADQRTAYQERAANAAKEARPPSSSNREKTACSWFHWEKANDFSSPETLGDHAGELRGPWAKNIDAQKADIRLRTRLLPADDSKKLLTTKGDVIIAEYQEEHWDTSRALLVANGSFLLNLPLMNLEHRKLAARLIEELGERANVAFLTSRPGGPPIDPPHEVASVSTLFGAWPLNMVLLHAALAGLIYCFSQWPIFGRPQEPMGTDPTDFGRHVRAVGRLLARTRERQSALDLIASVGAASEPKGK